MGNGRTDYNKTNEKMSASKAGSLNPMYGRRHTVQSKRQISDSLKQRYKKMKNDLPKEEELNEVIRRILREELKKVT